MNPDYEKRRQRMCYQKRLKNLFGPDWKKHFSEEDCRNYVISKEKPVCQIDPITNEVLKVWKSITAAEKSFSVKNGTVRLVCNGERKTAYGFKWRYA